VARADATTTDRSADVTRATNVKGVSIETPFIAFGV
jgi:hypothetical protein